MGTHQKLNLFSNMKLVAFVALAVFALVAISSLGFLGSEQGFVSRSLLAKNKDDPLYARPLAEDEIRYIKWQQRVKAIDYAKEVHELHDESSRKSHEYSLSSSDRSSWAGDREADKHARRVPIFKEAENRGEDLAESSTKIWRTSKATANLKTKTKNTANVLFVALVFTELLVTGTNSTCCPLLAKKLSINSLANRNRKNSTTQSTKTC